MMVVFNRYRRCAYIREVINFADYGRILNPIHPMTDIPQATPEPEVGAITGATSTHPLPNIPLMSHDEAEALRLRTLKQERISAILVAMLIHALIIVGLALWGLGVLEAEKPEIEARIAPPTENTVERPTVKTETLQRKPSSPSQSAKLISAAVPESAVFVPDVPFETDSIDIGTSANLGMGFGTAGSGSGDGQSGFGGVPAGMKGRCTLEERMKRLAESGGTKECEEAVVKSLTWLQLQQNADGSWGRSKKISMTGLVLLAYLGHCETPQSTQFGETVLNGMLFLIDQGMQNDGYFFANRQGNAWVYEHAIAVYALAESYAFTAEMTMEIPNLREVVEKGTDIILDGQHSSGGWDYNYNKSSGRGGDTSIVGWQVQALKAAQNAGYGTKFGAEDVLMRSVTAAHKYLENMQSKEGVFGYSSRGRGISYGLQGVGALCFQMFGKEGRPVRNALKIAQDTPLDYNAADANLYGWYYTTQAMFFKGGTYWEKWNDKWRDQILNNQGSDGAWKAEGATGHKSTHAAGADSQIYRNALCTLMLEVYYRFLPGTGS